MFETFVMYKVRKLNGYGRESIHSSERYRISGIAMYSTDQSKDKFFRLQLTQYP